MKRIVFSVVLGIIVGVLVAACAPLQLKPDATPDQTRAAWCSEAMKADAVAQAVMSTQTLTPEASKYWTAYKLGSALGLQTYCPSQ
jgi:hypothetical protein